MNTNTQNEVLEILHDAGYVIDLITSKPKTEAERIARHVIDSVTLIVDELPMSLTQAYRYAQYLANQRDGTESMRATIARRIFEQIHNRAFVNTKF